MENEEKRIEIMEEIPVGTGGKGGGGNDSVPADDFPDEFQCCICLDLLYKPVVLACGHISCFWCVYSSMNHIHESNCPICRCAFNHFPSICELLHFLLLKLYPIAYKRRESQVQEEEKQAGHFSPQFDQYLIEPQSDNTDTLWSNVSVAQEGPHSESCSKDGESSSFKDSQKTATLDENGMPIKLPISSKNPEDAVNAANQGCSCLRNNFEHVDQKKVSVTDLLCVACKKLLIRPVVLNCGHVYCESCFIIPNDEIPRCLVCQSLQPNGFPNVCLILEHFLEEQFPEKYSERRGAICKENNCSTQAQRHANRANLISTEVYSSWLLGNGPKVHIGVGCDYCGMSPIIGERYKCKDCVEKIGFDLCESCFKAPVKIPGRFNQQHKPEHRFEIIPPLSITDFISRLNYEHSDEEGSDVPEQRGDAPQTHTMLVDAQSDGGEEAEDASPSLILSVDESLDQEED